MRTSDFTRTTTRAGCCLRLGPALFGVAHLHHLLEKLRAGWPWALALQATLFQFAYTSVFGAYSGFLFLRTGHLSAACAAHCLCNYMQLPDVLFVVGEGAYARLRPIARYLLAAYLLGIVLFAALLFPLTRPEWYSSPFW